MNVYGWLKQTAGPHHWAQPAYKSVCVCVCIVGREVSRVLWVQLSPDLNFRNFQRQTKTKPWPFFASPSRARSFILGGEREKALWVCEIKCSSFGPAARSTRRLFVCFVELQTTDIITRLLNSCERERAREG